MEASVSDDPVVRFDVGEYYSPMYDTRELAAERQRLWPPVARETIGVDWRDARQLEICRDVFAKQAHFDFPEQAGDDPTEYFVANGQYPPLDAWVLEGLIRYLKPRRMIEVGCGFSTLVSARVNREHFDSQIDLTYIEPYPRSFLLDGIPGVSGLLVKKIQDAPLLLFEELEKDDILFIDTSHTVKTGGDVTWIFHEILPRREYSYTRLVLAGRVPGEMGHGGVGVERGVLAAVVPSLQLCLRDRLGRRLHAHEAPRRGSRGVPRFSTPSRDGRRVAVDTPHLNGLATRVLPSPKIC